jgi:hypothetical protein
MSKKLSYKITFLLSLVIFMNSQAQIFFDNNAIGLGLNANATQGTNLGGVSFYDFDDDGWDDITIGSKGEQPVRVFKNFGGILLEISLGVSINGHSKQVLWVDYDNDGDNDLFVTRNDDSNLLLRNEGNFNFSDVTLQSGLLSTADLNSFGAAFGDIDNDGYLDLFLSNKDNSVTKPNKLFRNNGNGTFTDISIAAGISQLGHASFCASFFDYNNDGYQDIYVSNDRINNTNILYKNNGNNTFTDVSSISGAGIAANAMSTTIDDFNYDGYLDIYITNTAEGNYLLKNNGDETFTNVASSTGTEFNSLGWGANFFDADNDTDLDLYVSSMVDDDTSSLLTAAFYECNSNYSYQLANSYGFENDTFESFSNAIGDIDNNGFVDFVVANAQPDNHSLWQNAGNSNNWLKVKLSGNQSNKNGIGSWIEVAVDNDVMYRYTLCGESFLGQNSASEIFGLANASNIDYVKVTWLSGIEDIFYNVAPNQTLLIQEGQSLSTTTFNEQIISMFPNPSKGNFTINNLSTVVKMRIADYNGRVILIQEVGPSNNEIDLSNLAPGSYLVHLDGSNSRKIIKKLILN